MKFVAKILSAGVMLAATAPFASASPIVGSFSLALGIGSYVCSTCAPGTANAFNATGLDFGSHNGTTGNGYGVNGTGLVRLANGSFMNLNGTIASVADIAFTGSLANPFTANPFISFGTNSNIFVNFANATISNRQATDTGDVIQGVATFSDGNPADATTGNFSLSTSSQLGTARDINFTFTSNVSANANPAGTPEPSSLALLGTGIASLGGLVRRRIKRA